MESEAPGTTVLAPGSVGEADAPWAIARGGYGSMSVLHAEDLAAAGGSAADAFSYHHYGAASQRCAAMGFQTTPQDALSEEWLARTDETLAYYRRVRDRYMSGKPFWNTETADAACGGNPWAGTFLDSFRYLDQLGRLARQEVRVVMHNTLVASDYGLLDERDFTPKPNYWSALLWRRLMGTSVLEAGVPVQHGLHVYTHCLRGEPGGVALLAINNGAETTPLAIDGAAQDGLRYTLSAPQLQSRVVLLNGERLALAEGDQLPPLRGAGIASGVLALAPETITFIALPQARNRACMEASTAQ